MMFCELARESPRGKNETDLVDVTLEAKVGANAHCNKDSFGTKQDTLFTFLYIVIITRISSIHFVKNIFSRSTTTINHEDCQFIIEDHVFCANQERALCYV